MQVVQAHHQVKIKYKTMNRDGAILEANINRTPLLIHMQDEHLIPALKKGMLGMAVGESKKIYAYPEEAFGLRNVQLQTSIPREFFQEQYGAGKQLAMSYQSTHLESWVVREEQDEVLLDCNHPLVGEMIVYEVTVVDII
jgi:FKBP-type peptidyl-prolyl cis-trans isomerase 2